MKVLSIENIDERVENIENIFDAYLEKKKSDPQISFNQNLKRKDDFILRVVKSQVFPTILGGPK